MSIIGALGGLGDAAQRMGETNQKAWLDQDSEALKQKFQRELVDLQAQKQMALETFKNTLATNTKNTERTNMAAAIDQGAGGIVDTAMQGHGVADQSTWTPEQEAARNQGIVGMKNNPRTRIQAATNAGYIDEASKMDKIADSGAKTTPWGSVTHDSDGKVIYDNASELKGKIAQQGADAKGAIKRADHFDEKQWDAAAKVPQHVISLRDPNNPDKEIEITALRSAYMKQFNANKSSGEMSPNEAIEHATTTIGMLRDKAQEMVDKAKAADPKSTLTQEAAIKTILKRAAEAEKPRASLSVTPTSVPAKQAGEDGFSIERTNDGVKVYSNDIDRVFVGAKTLSSSV